MSAFHFVNPWALGLLAAAPLLLAAFRYGDARRNAALRSWGRETAAATDRTRRRVKRALQILACIILALALARPATQAPVPPASAPANGDLVFLLDVSRSMLADDAPPARLFHARALIRQLAAHADAQRLALVAFAGTQAVQCPLTMDHAFFREMLDTASPEVVARGGSKLGDAIRFAVAHAFDDAERDSKTLVLISDGGDQENSPESAAHDAARNGIRLVTIGIGDESAGALVPESMVDRTPVIYRGQPVRTRLSAGTLRAVAAAGGGSYIHGGIGTLDTVAVYSRYLSPVARRAAAIETSDPWWQVLMALAILLLAWECALPERRLAQTALLAVAVLWWPAAGFAQTIEEWYAKGAKAMEEKRWVDALEAFATASRVDSTIPELRFNLARALYEFKSYGEAAASFEMAAVMSRDPQLKAKSKLGQGNSLYRQSQQSEIMSAMALLQKAIGAYQAALKLDSDLFDAEINRKVAGRRLDELNQRAFSQPPPGANQTSAPERPPSDAERILRETRPTTVPGARSKGQTVERDW